MNETGLNPYPPNAQPQMARERNRIAADRSLLSFIRNSLTLITAGVGIDEIVSLLSPEAGNLIRFSHILSLLLIALGVLSLIFAIRDYQGELHRLSQPEYYFTPRSSLGGAVGLSILLLGIVFFVWLVMKVVN